MCREAEKSDCVCTEAEKCDYLCTEAEKCADVGLQEDVAVTQTVLETAVCSQLSDNVHWTTGCYYSD